MDAPDTDVPLGKGRPEPGDEAWAPGGTMSDSWIRPREDDRAPPTGRDRHRPRRVAAGLVVVLSLAVVIAVVRRDDTAAPPPSTVGLAVPPTIAGGTGIPDRAVGIPAVPPTTAATGELGEEGAAAIDPEQTGVIESASPPVLTVIEIAPELTGLSPTEIVALDFQGSLVELSIPSGRVRTIGLGFPTDRSRLVTTDFGALVWPAPGIAYQLIAADGERGFVAADPVVAATASPGLDRFYVWHDRGDAATSAQPDVVTAAGSPAGGQPRTVAVSEPADALIGPDGAILFERADGTYRTDDDGTSQLSTGELVAVGRNHVLLRECVTGRPCSLVALGTDGFRTLYPTDLPTDATPLRSGGLAPSGDALLLAADRSGSVDNPPELQVLELVDGSRATLRSEPGAAAHAAWAIDSSGVFVTDVLLYYIDRASGAELLVSQGYLPKLRMVTTRRPAGTAPCELLGTVLPTFAAMRAADGATVAPPPIETLDRVLAALPDDVAGAAQPMVTFVAEFVSIEQPESRRPANWPSEVRAGLDALENFAAAC